MDKNAELASYRTCFSSDAGKRVLGDILINAGYFDTDLKTSEEIAVENFAKEILKKVLGGKEKQICSPTSVGSFVQKLFELPTEKG
jgi:hypothetical protein